MIGLPEIHVSFRQLAASVIERSSRGIVVIVMNDTVDSITVNKYESIYDVKEDSYSEENYLALADAFLGTPSTVYAIVLPTGETFETAVEKLNSFKFNYLCYLSENQQQNVVDYVKAYNEKTKTRKVKGVVFKNASDDKHIINFTNETVTRTSDNESISGWKYLARIAGLLAGMPFSRTSTYYRLTDLKEVQEPENLDEAIGNGEFVIMNDYGDVKVARGVTSLTTLPDKVKLEDFKKITIVEGADMIIEDISESFKTDYLGVYKNNLDNQMLLISAINIYLDQIAKEEVLDNQYDNHVEINIEAQRNAWINAGKIEANTWDDDTVMKNPYGSHVYLKGYIKFLDGMEDIELEFEC